MKNYIFLVFSNPTIGKEDAYNEWYDTQHLADVVNVPGFVSAERFKLADVNNTGPKDYKYLAIYTVRTDDVHATHEMLQAAAGTPAMVMSDAIVPTKRTGYFTPIGTKVTAPAE